MNKEDLDAIVAECERALSDPAHKRKALAYAALTHAKVLSDTWTHSAHINGKQTTVQKPAGQTVGAREQLEYRLNAMMTELRSPQ